MLLKSQDLVGHLAGTLASVYFITGDETLLVEEAAEAVLHAARAGGFTERSVLHAEGSFKWQELLQDAASLSLFADRKILDVRNPSAKFDKEASEVLRTYCSAPPEDTLLLLRSPRIDGRQKNAAWFKALDAAGVVVQIWPIGPAELPRWLEERARRTGIRLEKDAVQLLADKVEGNLLAAAQEMEKLKLADLPEPIDVATLTGYIEDSAHYDTFELIDAVFGGDVARIPRMVRGLRAEGVALFAVQGALTAQLRQISQGRVPPFRRRQTDRLVRRLGSVETVDRVLAQCAIIDQQGKGQLLGDAWQSFEDLLLRLAGARLPSLEQRLPALRRP